MLLKSIFIVNYCDLCNEPLRVFLSLVCLFDSLNCLLKDFYWLSGKHPLSLLHWYIYAFAYFCSTQILKDISISFSVYPETLGRLHNYLAPSAPPPPKNYLCASLKNTPTQYSDLRLLLIVCKVNFCKLFPKSFHIF